MKLYPMYKMRVVFKSGYVHEGWYWKFDWEYKGDEITSISWHAVNRKEAFQYLKVNQIESITTLKIKQVFRFKSLRINKMKGYVVVECTNGKCYESKIAKYDEEQFQSFVEIASNIKNLKDLRLECSSGDIYFNPNQVVAIWFKETF